ncbi:inactive ferrous ion transporter periplasmic protein EfeO [compost metagenome]
MPKIDQALADFDSELDNYKIKDGYASYDAISGEQRKQIADKAQALADALDGIDPALGLSGL